VPPQPYEGPATFHVDGLVYRIPLLRLELQERATSGGMPDTLPHPVVIVLERGELTKDATKKGTAEAQQSPGAERLVDRSPIRALTIGDALAGGDRDTVVRTIDDRLTVDGDRPSSVRTSSTLAPWGRPFGGCCVPPAGAR
jgi:hypothetical protein